jgi:hypothetical protein
MRNHEHGEGIKYELRMTFADTVIKRYRKKLRIFLKIESEFHQFC